MAEFFGLEYTMNLSIVIVLKFPITNILHSLVSFLNIYVSVHSERNDMMLQSL